ncbi:PREDICTED: feather keratin 1-like [Tinamus guttatus]|nr:PREDICTED: feather keratin 1-like [Tinamus guttatus]
MAMWLGHPLQSERRGFQHQHIPQFLREFPNHGGLRIYLHPREMSCYDVCPPTPCGPTPLANSCNEPCVRQCQDSTVVIQPSPVVVTLPGPILSSFPQNTTVGSSASAAVGSALSTGGVPISSGSSSGLGSLGYSGLGSGYSRPYRRYNTYRSGLYGPC